MSILHKELNNKINDIEFKLSELIHTNNCELKCEDFDQYQPDLDQILKLISVCQMDYHDKLSFDKLILIMKDLLHYIAVNTKSTNG